MATSYDAFGNPTTDGAPTTRRITPGQKLTPGVNRLTGKPNKTNTKASAKGQQLKFPLENQDVFKGKMTFQPVKIIPPGKQAIDEIVKTAKYAASTYDEAGTGVQSEPEKPPSISNWMKYTMLDDKIEMYLPIAYQVNDMLAYETAGLGILGGGMVAAAENTAAIGNSIKQFISGGGSASDAMSKITGASTGDLVRAMTARVGAAAVAGGAVSAAVGKMAGGAALLAGGAALAGQSAATVLQVKPNPNNRAVFNGVANREFTFQFKLVPTSPDEAKQIRDIIKMFRVYAYPENITVARLPVAYKFPHLWKIKIRYNGLDVGTRIKMCYLRNVAVTYNPTASSFYADAEPVETDLSLSFIEYIPIASQDVAGDWYSRKENDIDDQEDARYWDNGGGF